MNQFLDTIGGLPLHPLTVHAASVLIPLSALALAPELKLSTEIKSGGGQFMLTLQIAR
jgi:hypothetical protein